MVGTGRMTLRSPAEHVICLPISAINSLSALISSIVSNAVEMNLYWAERLEYLSCLCITAFSAAAPKRV